MPKKKYDFFEGSLKLEEIMSLPDDSTVVKLFYAGDVSSANFVDFVAQRTRINELTVSSLRVGEKQIRMLDQFFENGSLLRANLIVAPLMRRSSRADAEYAYFDTMTQICQKNGFRIIEQDNHSKIVLMDTIKGKFVLESSSNFNNNPKNEQFSFEKSTELYDFYYRILIGS